MGGQIVDPKDLPVVHVPTYHPARQKWGLSFLVGALMFGCCVGGLLAWFKWLNSEASDATKRDTAKLPKTVAKQPAVQSATHRDSAKAPQPGDSQVAVHAVPMNVSGLPVKFSATGESQFGSRDPFAVNPFESKLTIEAGTTIDDLVLAKLAELNIKPDSLRIRIRYSRSDRR